jgi:hypothetical protein
MISARKDVSSVPTRKGSAPYTLLTGSQVLLQKKEKPKAFIDGMACTTRVIKIPRVITTMTKAMITSVLLNAVSVLIFPYEKILETLSM